MTGRGVGRHGLLTARLDFHHGLLTQDGREGRAVNRGFEYRRRVGADAAGLTAVEYLARCYSRFSREEWLDRIRSGRVLLDVAKPRGLPTIPGGGGFVENTLLSLVRGHFPGASPLHRLGRGTSGIVLFAGTSQVASKVSQQWRRGEILKVYRALVAGCPALDEFAVDVPIGPVPHPILKTIHAASPAGKSAHSHVKVLERRDGRALVEVRITTGRPHQIRIHLAAAGHPLVGDPLYAAGGAPTGDSRALPGDPGYYLHGSLLGFAHSDTGEWTEIACGPPPQLRLPSER